MKLAQARMESADALPPRRAAQILRKRARSLAAPNQSGAAAEKTTQMVGFSLRGAPRLVESRFVREVAKPLAWTRVPRAPDLLLGIINVRGTLLPVFDLARLLGEDGGSADTTRLIIFGEQEAEFAAPVGAVEPARSLRDDAITPPLGGEARESGLIMGMAADGVPILDGHVLIRDPRLSLEN